ncbi:MAG: mannose-1-phosphate guanylyltransferase [Bacteroides sp.]|nr:mannose-1-phosphate guanylyltransferase [Prevotella sp.]MCM1407846.1 mannose-1-phosphate guanylyltransferase [Treponema brennaborense]MCM1469588.1 mannose-1-phosphate guanylyltransferase [Bacteroides sp.]
MFSDIIILAGGIGERLWPASTPECPKQFMSLPNGVSFYQEAVLRALALKPCGSIIVVTRSSLLNAAAAHTAALLEKIPAADAEKIKKDLYIIPEPEAKHTAPPIALCCAFAKKIRSERADADTPCSFLVLTSDHIIEPAAQFAADAEKASEAAQKGHFVCFGIPPASASTGFGYIKHGAAADSADGIFAVEHFKEKPDAETAQRYVESGDYWWNSGIFGFADSLFISEIKKYEPALYNAFLPLLQDCGKIEISAMQNIQYVSSWQNMNAAYKASPSVSIDIAVAERTNTAAAVKAHFAWNDVGSWDAFRLLFDAHDCPKTAEINSSGNFVYADMPVAICGVSDLTVVVKNNKVLVMKNGSSDFIREAVTEMKKE